MSYHRPPSPGSRRLMNPGRVSDSLTDPYYARSTTYANPRASTGVIPISTQTFVNVPPPPGTLRTSEHRGDRFDSYSGRPRRSSLVDTSRGSSTTASQATSRSRPIVQDNRSPPRSTREKDYYVTPAVSKESRKVEHKKLYSVDDGSATLVADVNLAPPERHHRRKESSDRSTHRPILTDRDRDRGRRTDYHVTGGHNRGREKSIEDDDAYSYTDPAGMFRDTEPRWREHRPRRGSMDRTGISRERPMSLMVEPTVVGALGGALGGMAHEARANTKEGPPPSTRGWDKINDGLGRTRSARDSNRSAAPASPTRGRTGTFDNRDPYYVPPRTNSTDRRTTAHGHDRPLDPRYDGYGYDDRREPRHERRNSITRAGDRSVERRGFGIRADSQDRYGRGSDESFERQQRAYREPAFAEPHRRDTAPDMYYPPDRRVEPERPERSQTMPRGQTYERDVRDNQPRRDDTYRDDRDYENRDRERQRERDREFDKDRERERERERMMDRDSDRERERHHIRRDTDRDYRKENGSKDDKESSGHSGLAKAATGGLAGVAAALGVGKLLDNNKNEKDREREKERDREKDRDRERDREHDRERDRERERDRDRDREKERERAREDERDLRYDEPKEDRERRHHIPQDNYSEEGERERLHRPSREADRGLGFAFENPRGPETSAAAPTRTEERANDTATREVEESTSEMPPPPTLDPDEDYRRRMEQVQRELGRTNDSAHQCDSDGERERRRREREQRQREREARERAMEQSSTGSFHSAIGLGAATAGAGAAYSEINSAPPHSALRREADIDSEISSQMPPGLRRRPSILDEPMLIEQPAQIIDNSQSERRENRVRIVDPPTEEEERKPKGILKKPTEKFPEDQSSVREGVAPLKDATKKGIPPGARWTKIDRRLVNPEALDEAKERFEERLDCVIVLRVLTKEEIQKLADRTKQIRDERYDEERDDRKSSRRRERRQDRADRDEYDDDSEDEYKSKPAKMLEAPSQAGAPVWSGQASNSTTNGWSAAQQRDEPEYVRERRRDRHGDNESQYMSGGLGRRE